MLERQSPQVKQVQHDEQGAGAEASASLVAISLLRRQPAHATDSRQHRQHQQRQREEGDQSFHLGCTSRPSPLTGLSSDRHILQVHKILEQIGIIFLGSAKRLGNGL